MEFVDAFQIISLTVNNDISKNQIFSIYPNPFEKELNVALINNEVSEIILYDIASRKIMQRQFTNSDSFSTEQLAKGMYLYEIRDRNGLYTKGKVVKD
ncbi:MAG: T9SS type A sorting domain-containing protein [Saprospiraceae bacterium]|nr:T9SS type A sorting domain-containing protein [Saprospiraceae bacterium]